MAALNAGAKYPELVAAQWALESAWGKEVSGKYNYFGLKGQGTTCSTHEYEDGLAVDKEAEFVNFDSMEECVQYLVDRWYKDWMTYKGVNSALNAEAAARELVRQNYATDPEYANKLIRLMKENKSKNPKVKPSVKPVVFKLTAVQDTFLKKTLDQSSDLGSEKKVVVKPGTSYGVSTLEELPQDAHAKVVLAAESGTWYIWQPHWSRSDNSGEALTRDIDWKDFNCLVTPNLSVGEILQWDIRRAPAPASGVRMRLLRTAAEFQKVRTAWGRPLGVTSFYRPEPINQQVGGVPGSRHTTGEAFDIYPVDDSLERFYRWIRVRWSGGLGDGRHRGFIHLDTRSNGHFVPGAGVSPIVEWTY